jgi:P-type E1-E2 ATPase
MSSTSEVASTWTVASAVPGRIRVRHTAIRDRDRAHRIEAELAATHGVVEAHARPLTAGLLVRYDPRAISQRQLLGILEDLAAPESRPAPAGHLPPARFGMVNVSLAVAVTAELAVPPLLPVSAVLLVVSSVREVREAWRDLRRRRVGLPVLFTAIHVGTMLSGHFVVAALMGWTYQFWRHRHRAAQLALRRELLPSLTQRPRFARLCVGGAEVEVPTDRLRPGDRIVVEEGEMVPADGWLAGGFAAVDERMVGGIAGLTRKEPGDPVYAGSFAAEGRLYLEVSGLGTATRAARLARELTAATVSAPTEFALTARGEAFARQAVGPTLAAAGFGLVIGDLATASAILQPDYATGPGLGVSMESLRDIADCAVEGVVVRDPSTFQRIAAADVFLFDHHPGLERAGLEVREVQVLDGVAEEDILRLAASAFADLADERSPALLAACAARRIIVRRDRRPSYRGPEIALCDGSRSITLRDRREIEPAAESSPALEVAIDGRPVGRIAFGRSSRPRAAEAIGELRRHGPMAIGLLSDRPDPQAASLAEALGMDFHLGGLSPDGKAEAVRSCRRRGLKVAYIGDCRREPEPARAADVAISMAHDIDPANDPAQLLVLRPDLGWIAGLRERSRSHVDRLRAVHSFVLIPNLCCIAGAFFLGFTSLSAVVLTNLGTFAVYAGLPRRRGLRALPAVGRAGRASSTSPVTRRDHARR